MHATTTQLLAVALADKQRLLGIVLLCGLLLLILELVRRKHLMERYALLWLFATIVLLVFVAWRGLLSTLSYKVGIHYPPSALFAVALGLGLILLVHFSLAISRLSDQNKVLAQRVGILQQRLDEHDLALGTPFTPALQNGVAAAPGSPTPAGGASELSHSDAEELSRAG